MKGWRIGIGLAVFIVFCCVYFWYFILLPVGTKSRATEYLLQGKHIHNAYFHMFDFTYESPPPSLPASSGSYIYTNSTACFIDLVTKGFLEVGGNYFSGPGLGFPVSNQVENLQPEHVLWCIVSDVDEFYPDSAPFLFTRNIAVTNMADFHGPISTLLSTEKPYGKNLCIIITKGGTGYLMYKEGLNKDLSSSFNTTGLTNKILRP